MSRASATLIGRDGDLAYVTALVDRAAISGGALLLPGEPGVGKTALLDAAARGRTLGHAGGHCARPG